MREIKFRAWYGNKMWSVSSIRFDEGKVYLSETDDLSPDTYAKINDKELKLMQYIGLKDRNGKEIYEGDILGNEEISSGVVEWNNSMSQFRVASISNGSKIFALLEIELEYNWVIGNIYENSDKVPKLLY
jgi:uncharacterized phage protein (TIGR01671 family)